MDSPGYAMDNMHNMSSHGSLSCNLYRDTIYVEIFEWLNFRKKSGVSNFENIIFENGARV